MSQRKDETSSTSNDKAEQPRARSRRRNPSPVRKARKLGAQAISESREFIDDAQDFYTTMQRSFKEARTALYEQAERRPYLVVGGAFITGFVLGRRLPPSLARMAVAYGGRAALSMVMRQVLA